MTHALESCNLVTYVDSKGQAQWEKAMLIEMDSILNDHTLYLVPRPQGKYCGVINPSTEDAWI